MESEPTLLHETIIPLNWVINAYGDLVPRQDPSDSNAFVFLEFYSDGSVRWRPTYV